MQKKDEGRMELYDELVFASNSIEDVCCRMSANVRAAKLVDYALRGCEVEDGEDCP